MRLPRAFCGFVEDGLEGGLKELFLGEPVLLTEEDRWRHINIWNSGSG